MIFLYSIVEKYYLKNCLLYMIISVRRCNKFCKNRLIQYEYESNLATNSDRYEFFLTEFIKIEFDRERPPAEDAVLENQ